MSDNSRVLRHRRAFVLVLLSAVLPGSAQWLAGNRRVGRIAMTTAALLLGVLLLTGLGLWFWRDLTVRVLLQDPVPAILRVLTWMLLGAWLVLLGDAWRLARPPRLARWCRLALTTACLVLTLLAATATTLLASALTAAGHVSRVLQGGGETEAKAGRYNILLLGVDAAADREGIRPDSINVASIDATTGRSVVFGLPRNLMGVPFPPDSPLHALHPEGYRCGGECMLNGIYSLGQENAASYPGRDAGLAATTEAVEATLGLEINYYAMVDLAGFQSLIDAVGGIRLDIGKRVPIGGIGSAVNGYIGPGQEVHLDGYHALWFARSRVDSDDYERMVRQKCVLAAMAKQLDPAVMATRFVDLAAASSDIVRTDVGPGEVSQLAELALKGRSLPVETVNFAPPLIETAHPDLELIRATVIDTIAASQDLDAPTTDQPDPAVSSGDADSDGEPAGPAPEAAPATEETTPVAEEEPVCRVS